MGENGSGTAEFFGFADEVDIVMGTFSKTFSVTGGFISSSKPIINYLRYFARPYMFSATLPPATIASVIAGLDVIREEPDLRSKLHHNVGYVRERLAKFNMIGKPEAGIISLLAPAEMNIRKAAYDFDQAGIFLNAIEYPAVPENMQRFRISIMATHTKEDLDRLVENVEEIWHQNM
jgi:glycine C-acetyltransferase